MLITLVFGFHISGKNLILLKKHIYFWLCWVFAVAHQLSLVAANGGYSLVAVPRASHCGGFSSCRAQARGMWASVVVAQQA